MSDMHIVGKKTPAARANEIVTGQARYCPDIELPGMLFGKLLYSPYARARVIRLDASKARKIPGVTAIITHADIPGENSYLYSAADQPLLVVDEVRYRGEAIAAVAAKRSSDLRPRRASTIHCDRAC